MKIILRLHDSPSYRPDIWQLIFNDAGGFNFHSWWYWMGHGEVKHALSQFDPVPDFDVLLEASIKETTRRK